ncbi:uncharacterized protein LOC131649593 [Vicia villosa]|uniref:uncharacterized protein LOC131649593 n=1 Tax=Vicia villosa TaxID=3911 RepID=UPI00273BDDCE|nr:uncharacterized protein LOC131649593 [Vicia villosa]
MWSIIETENFNSMTAPTDTVPAAPKPQASWTPEEKNQVLLNSKAQFILSCALSREEYDRIEECNTAKEIWDKLKIHHEGTSHVKEQRIDMGVRKFETFEMKEDETIDEMFSRFTIIINELRSLVKNYSAHERIRKLLRCLPKVWRPMVTAITQAKDLTTLPVEELVGSLHAHECIILEDKPQKKGKSIALKAAQNSKETQMKSEESNETPSEYEDDLALISKRIRQMVFRRGQNKRPFRREPQKAEIDKSKITCFGCNKVGHFKTECPQQKRFVKGTPFKKKSMMASWDDSENSNSDTDEEEANLCLMTTSDSEVSPLITCNTCHEMNFMFDNLLEDSNLLTQKCLFQKEQISNLIKEKEDLKRTNDKQSITITNLCNAHSSLSSKQKVLIEKSNLPKIETLENKIENLTQDITKFVRSTETFQNIMGSQSDNLGKFDSKLDKGIFIGYSQTSKGYRIYNLKNQCVEESMHVIFNATNEPSTIENLDDELDEQEEILN